MGSWLRSGAGTKIRPFSMACGISSEDFTSILNVRASQIGYEVFEDPHLHDLPYLLVPFSMNF